MAEAAWIFSGRASCPSDTNCRTAPRLSQSPDPLPIDKVAVLKVNFSGSEAGTLLADVFSEVDKATREFGDGEWRLFDAVASSPNSVEVALITRKVFGGEFQRNSEIHEVFRKLRNASLIRPDEGSTWRPENYAGLPTLGRLVPSNPVHLR